MFVINSEQGQLDLKCVQLILFCMTIVNLSQNQVYCQTDWSYEGSAITFRANNSEQNRITSKLSSICRIDPALTQHILLDISNTNYENYYFSLIFDDLVTDSNNLSQITVGDMTMSNIAKHLTNVNISTDILNHNFDVSIDVVFRANSSAKFTITAIQPKYLFLNDIKGKGDCLPDNSNAHKCSETSETEICETEDLQETSSSGKGPSGGQIAGIVCGCVAAMLIIGALVYYFVFYRNRSPSAVLPSS